MHCTLTITIWWLIADFGKFPKIRFTTLPLFLAKSLISRGENFRATVPCCSPSQPLVITANPPSADPAIAVRPEDSKNLENCMIKHESTLGHDRKNLLNVDNNADSNRANGSRRIRYLSQSDDTHDYLFVRLLQPFVCSEFWTNRV